MQAGQSWANPPALESSVAARSLGETPSMVSSPAFMVSAQALESSGPMPLNLSGAATLQVAIDMFARAEERLQAAERRHAAVRFHAVQPLAVVSHNWDAIAVVVPQENAEVVACADQADVLSEDRKIAELLFSAMSEDDQLVRVRELSLESKRQEDARKLEEAASALEVDIGGRKAALVDLAATAWERWMDREDDERWQQRLEGMRPLQVDWNPHRFVIDVQVAEQAADRLPTIVTRKRLARVLRLERRRASHHMRWRATRRATRQRLRGGVVVCVRAVKRVCPTMQTAKNDDSKELSPYIHVHRLSDGELPHPVMQPTRRPVSQPAAAQTRSPDHARVAQARLMELADRFNVSQFMLDQLQKDLSEVEEGLSTIQMADLASHVLVGVFETGCCITCTLSLVVPQLAPAATIAMVALRVCEHAHDVAHQATATRGSKQVVPTAGEIGGFDSTYGPLSAPVRLLCRALGRHVSHIQVLNVLTALSVVSENPESYRTRVNACITFVNTVLSNQKWCVDHLEEITKTLLKYFSYQPTMFGASFSMSDLSAALLKGEVADNMPKWIGNILWVASRLLGLSASASVTEALLPKFVMKYCSRTKVLAGDIIDHALTGAWDLVCRSMEAFRERSLEPFFRTTSNIEEVRLAMQYCQMTPQQIPGDGEGEAQILSRLGNLQRAEAALELMWRSLQPGFEKAQAMKAIAALRIKANECMSTWYAPTGRPRPMNIAVVGSPGLGKTFLTTAFFRVFCSAINVEYDSYMEHTHEASFSFWDDYDARLQRFIIMDEVGAVSKDKVEGTSFGNLLKLMGEAAYNLPMADLNKIGKMYCAQYATVLTSNVEDLGVDGMLATPSALFRRLAGMVVIKAHPSALREEGSAEINPAILADAKENTPLWIGEIRVPIVKSGTCVHWRVVARFSTVKEFVAAIFPMVVDFLINNKRYIDGTKQRADMITKCCEASRGEETPLQAAALETIISEYSDSMHAMRDKKRALEVVKGLKKTKPTALTETISNYTAIPEAWVHVGLSEASMAIGDYTYANAPWQDWGYAARGACVYAAIFFLFYNNAFWISILLFIMAGLKFLWETADKAANTMLVDGAQQAESKLEKLAVMFVNTVDDAVGVLLVSSFLPPMAQLALFMWRSKHNATLCSVKSYASKRAFFAVVPLAAAAFAAYVYWLRTERLVESKIESEAEIGAKKVNPTNGEGPRYGMSYDEYRKTIKENPVGWFKELKEKLRAPPELHANWKEEAVKKVVLSSISKELLPKAISDTGTEALIKLVESNTFAITVECLTASGNTFTRYATALCIGRTWYLTAWHVFSYSNVVSGRIRVHARVPEEKAFGERWHPFTVGINVARVDVSDVCAMNIVGLPRSPLRQFFPTEISSGQPQYGTKAYIWRPQGRGFVRENTIVASSGKFDAVVDGDTILGMGLTYHLMAPSQETMSGAPVVLSAAGRGAVIGGLISGNDVTFDPVRAVVDMPKWPDIEDALRIITHSQTGIIHTGGMDFTKVVQVPGVPHYKSWLRNFDGSERFILLGKSNKRVSHKGRFRLNPATEAMPKLKEWVRLAGGAEYVVPPFEPFLGVNKEEGLEWFDPNLNKVEPMGGDSFLPPELLRLAGLEYLAGLPDLSGQPGGTGRLTWSQAVFGCPERGVPALDLNRSAGIEGGKKYQHVDVESKSLSPELLKAVEEYDLALREDRVPPAEFVTMLKAELRKWDKAAAGLTRHISPTAFAVLIVQRAYFAPLVLALLRTGAECSTSAIGVNAADPRQWGALANLLLKYAEDGQVSDGDLKFMDLEEGNDTRDVESAIFGAVAVRVGYPTDEVAVVERLVYASGFCLIHLDGLLILCLQGRFSGEFATDFFNCLELFIILCVAYYICAAKAGVLAPQPFRGVVFAPSVGDDHVRACAPSIRQWYNARTINEALKPSGHVYTTANKTLDFADDFKPLRDAVFLQRRFEPVAYGNGWLYAAPLGLDRIAKSMHVIPASGSVADSVYCDGILMNAQRELFMHGREAFDAFQSVLSREPIIMPDDSLLRVRFLSYAELHEEWTQGKLKTYDSGGQLDVAPQESSGVKRVSPTAKQVNFASVGVATAAFLLILYYMFLFWIARAAYNWMQKLNNFLDAISEYARTRDNVEIDTVNLARAPPEKVDAVFSSLTNSVRERRKAYQDLLNSLRSLWDKLTKLLLILLLIMFAPRLGVKRIQRTAAQEESLNLASSGALQTTQATATIDSVGESAVTLQPSDAGTSASVGVQADWFNRVTLLTAANIASTSTNATNGYFLSINPFDFWAQQPAMLRKWANNRFLRGGVLRVQIQVAATPLHRGAMVIGFAPSSRSWRAAQTNVYPHQIAQMESKVVNLSGAFTETFDIPLINAAGSIVDMTAGAGVLGTQSTPWLFLALLSPLTHCSLATAPTVPLIIRASLIKGDFYSPTDFTAYTVTMKSEVTTQGVYSRTAGIIAKALGAVSSLVPAIAPYTLPASYLAQGVSSIAAALGFGRPAERVAPMLMAQAPNADLTASNVNDPIFVLSTDSAASTSPSPSAGGWPAEDQMSLGFLASRWSIVAGSSLGSEWATTAAYGSVLMTIPVSPYTVDAGLDASLGYCPQPNSVVGLAHSFWRGKAELKVMAFAGSLDVGRLKIYWAPGTGSVGTFLDRNSFYSCILDIAQGTECTLEVGWHDFPTALCAPATFSAFPATTYAANTFSAGCNNGVVIVLVDSPLVSNQAVTSIGVKVFIRWKELAFFRPSVRLLNNLQYTSKTVYGMSVPDQGDVQDIVYAQSETTTHLRQLLTRYWPSFSFSPCKQNNADVSASGAFAIPPWGWDGSVLPNSLLGVTYRQRSATPWEYAYKCYSVYRGGAKIRFVTYPSAQSVVLGWLFTVGMVGWVAYGAISTLVSNIVGVVSGPGVTGFQRMAQRYDSVSGWGNLDNTGTSVFKGNGELAGAVVPYRDMWPWRSTAATAQGPCAPTATTVPYETLVVAYSLTDNGNTTSVTVDTTVDAFRAFADDIVLHGFICCPIISSGHWPNF